MYIHSDQIFEIKLIIFIITFYIPKKKNIFYIYISNQNIPLHLHKKISMVTINRLLKEYRRCSRKSRYLQKCHFFANYHLFEARAMGSKGQKIAAGYFYLTLHLLMKVWKCTVSFPRSNSEVHKIEPYIVVSNASKTSNIIASRSENSRWNDGRTTRDKARDFGVNDEIFSSSQKNDTVTCTKKETLRRFVFSMLMYNGYIKYSRH